LGTQETGVKVGKRLVKKGLRSCRTRRERHNERGITPEGKVRKRIPLRIRDQTHLLERTASMDIVRENLVGG